MKNKSKEKLFEIWRKKSAEKFADKPEHTITYNGEIYTAGEVRFLRYVKEKPGKTSIQLSNESGKTRGTVSLIIKKLVEKELVLFNDSPVHGKKKIIVITPLGHEICRIREESDRKDCLEFITELSKNYSSEEISQAMPIICDIISMI